VTTLL